MGAQTTRRGLMAPCLFAALTVSAVPVTADTVYLQSGSGRPVALEGIKVVGVQGQNLTFTTAAGIANTKPLDHVPQIRLDDEPVFSAAEDEFARSDWAAAADKYRSVIAGSSPDWVKLRSVTRLAEAGERSGKSDDAVTAFVAFAKMWPAYAADHKPKVGSIPQTQLDSAIAIIKQTEADPKLSKDSKAILLKYLIDLYGSATESASRELLDVVPPPPPAPKPSPPPLPPAIPAGPAATNDPPQVEFEKALDAARKVRDAKIGSAGDEFKAAAVAALRRLTDRRKVAFEIAVATYDVRIKEITKTGDLDKALAMRAEKDRYVTDAKRQEEQLVNEWRAADGPAAGGPSEAAENSSRTGDTRIAPPMLLGPLNFVDRGHERQEAMVKVRLTEAWLTLAQVPKNKRIGLSVYEEPEAPAEVEAINEGAFLSGCRVPGRQGIWMYYGGAVQIRCVLARSATATLRVVIEPDGLKH